MRCGVKIVRSTTSTVSSRTPSITCITPSSAGLAVAIAGVAAFILLVARGAVVLGKFAGGTGTMVGLALAAFSQEPEEDELTRKLRLESAYWAVMTGISMLVGANTIAFFVDGSADFYTGTGLMCAVLSFFLVRFHSARPDLRPDTPEA